MGNTVFFWNHVNDMLQFSKGTAIQESIIPFGWSSLGAWNIVPNGSKELLPKKNQYWEKNVCKFSFSTSRGNEIRSHVERVTGMILWKMSCLAVSVLNQGLTCSATHKVYPCDPDSLSSARCHSTEPVAHRGVCAYVHIFCMALIPADFLCTMSWELLVSVGAAHIVSHLGNRYPPRMTRGLYPWPWKHKR